MQNNPTWDIEITVYDMFLNHGGTTTALKGAFLYFLDELMPFVAYLVQPKRLLNCVQMYKNMHS